MQMYQITNYSEINYSEFHLYLASWIRIIIDSIANAVAVPMWA